MKQLNKFECNKCGALWTSRSPIYLVDGEIEKKTPRDLFKINGIVSIEKPSKCPGCKSSAWHK